MEFALLDFGLAWDPSPFLLSYISLLEWECLSYACSTITFWKHIPKFVSQIHQMEQHLDLEVLSLQNCEIHISVV